MYVIIPAVYNTIANHESDHACILKFNGYFCIITDNCE